MTERKRSTRRRPQMNIIDRAVSWLSPRAALRRMQYRHALNVFEGAGKGRRFRDWRTPDSSIQSDTRRGLHTLRARARDLGQNNAYAAAAHREIPANIVGAGITPHADLQDRDQRRQVEDLAKAWFDSTDCDADGLQNFYGLQHLVARTVVEAGECLVVRRRRTAPGSRIPLQVRVLEPDHIDTQKDGLVNGSNITIQGVEFDGQGRRVAYWLFDQHPGDRHYRMTQISSRRVPASDVLHVFRVERAGQVRGIPWGAPIIVRLRDFDEYEDAQLTRQKIAACFSVFITPGETFGALDDPAKPDVDDDEEKLYLDRVEPGIIEWLHNGKDVKFANPPTVQGYGEYSNVTLHQIAAGFGLPYSVLTGDLRQTSFTSGRMGERAFNRNLVGWQQNLMIPRLCQPVWRWWMEALVAARILPEAVPGKWSPPRRELTDPAREIPAIRDEVRSGFITLPEAVRQRGWDWDDFVREVADANKLMDELGLVFDSDARKVSGAGLTQARPPDSEIPAPNPSDGDSDAEPEE